MQSAAKSAPETDLHESGSGAWHIPPLMGGLRIQRLRSDIKPIISVVPIVHVRNGDELLDKVLILPGAAALELNDQSF